MIRKTKVADIEAQKVVEIAIHMVVQLIFSALMDQAEKQPATSDAQLEEVVVEGEVLKTDEVHVAEVISRLKTIEGASEAEASSVLEGVVSEAAINLSFEADGEK